MSLINWLQAKKTGLLRSGGQPHKRKSFGQSTRLLVSPRRGRRILRREQLFSVVRESMIRGGVLSTSYDFKVLTLDADGDSFLVLIDLALPADVMPDPYLLEIERWVQNSAQSRHSMSIPSVYWRRRAARDQRGMALKAAVAAQTQRPASSGHSTAIPTPPTSQRNAQAVDKAEVEAFRQALAAAASPLRRRPGDTEEPVLTVPESHSDFSALSETQYGKL